MLTTTAFIVATGVSMLQAKPAVAAPPTVSFKRVKTFDGLRMTAAAAPATGPNFGVALENRDVKLMNAKTLQGFATLKGHPQAVYGLAFSPDGKLVLTGDDSGRIWLWDTKTAKKLREFPRDRGHTRGIQSLTFSPDGKQFASVGKDDVIFIWNTAGGHPIKKLPGNAANFYGAQYTPSGSLIAGTLKEGARLYAPKTFSLAATMTLAGGQGANNVAANRLGSLMVTCGRDGKVAVWNVANRQRVAYLVGHTDWVMNATISPNGKYVATSSNDRSVRVWDMKSYKQVGLLDNQSPLGSPITFTGDGNFLITSSESDFIQVWAVTPTQGAAAPAAPTKKKRR